MRKPQQIMGEKYLAAAVVFAELWPIAVRHKKITLLVILFHIWCYSLVFQHLQDIKDIADMFPVLGSLFGNSQ